jgi:O-antigen ligase
MQPETDTPPEPQKKRRRSKRRRSQKKQNYYRITTFTAWLTLLTSAVAALLFRGWDPAYLAVFLVPAGLAMLVVKPAPTLKWFYWVGALFLVCWATLAFWPAPQPGPDWLRHLSSLRLYPGSELVTGMPLITAWWFLVLLATCFVTLFILSTPLHPQDQATLSLFFGLCLAGYAAGCIYAEISAWNWPFDGGIEGASHTFGILPNRNHSASIISAGAVLLMGQVLMRIQKREIMRAGLAAIGLGICALALTQYSPSRAGVILLGVGFVLWLMLQHREMLSKPVIISSVSVGLGVLLIVVMNQARVSDRLRDLAREAPKKLVAEDLFDEAETDKAGPLDLVEEQSKPIDFRVSIHQDALGVIADRPLMGWGLGTFRYVMPFYRDASLMNKTALHPESSWLLLASEMGWVAVGAVLLLLGTLYTRIPRMRMREGWTGRSAAVAALTIGLVHGVVDVPLHRPASGWVYLMMLGLAFHPPLKDKHAWRWGWGIGWRWAVLAVGGLAFVSAGIWLIVRSSGDNLPIGPGELEAREQAIVKLYQSDDREAAADFAWESIQRHPMHDGFYYQLATILAGAEGMEDNVAGLFAVHSSLNPYWAIAPFYQGRVWQSWGEYSRSLKAWGEALDRQARISKVRGEHPATRRLFDSMLRISQDDQELYDTLFEYAQQDQEMLIRWFQRRKTTPETQHFWAAEQLFSAPAFYDFWYKRGNRDSLRAFLELNPQYVEAGWKPYSRLLHERDHLEAAVRLYLENRPEIREKLKTEDFESDTLSEISDLLAAGNTISAERIRKEALQSSKDQAFLLHQAKIAIQEENWEDAWRYLNQLD